MIRILCLSGAIVLGLLAQPLVEGNRLAVPHVESTKLGPQGMALVAPVSFDGNSTVSGGK